MDDVSWQWHYSLDGSYDGVSQPTSGLGTSRAVLGAGADAVVNPSWMYFVSTSSPYKQN